ncbi:MAG: ROK family protein [Desulfobacteraceae bacterium]|nr:ROK family protein [Desulfobacteraceae bacterium]
MTDTYRLGIDLGGTKIESILLDPRGNAMHRERVSTPRGGDDEYEGIRNAVFQLILKTLDLAPATAACTIGVGIPGMVHPETHRVSNANTTSLIGKPLKADLEKLLGRPVVLENDANCFTLSEAVGGAAKEYDFVFGMILGTGCGGGICHNRKIIKGRHRIAGEWGHFPVDPLGVNCWCGNTGCIETKLSGTGVANAYERLFHEKITLEEIVRRYRAGDAKSTAIFEQFLEDFGRCVGGLISTMDPDAIVIGGGVSNIDELFTLGVERVEKYAFHDHITTPILKNQLGDSSGVYGAAWIGV